MIIKINLKTVVISLTDYLIAIIIIPNNEQHSEDASAKDNNSESDEAVAGTCVSCRKKDRLTIINKFYS